MKDKKNVLFPLYAQAMAFDTQVYEPRQSTGWKASQMDNKQRKARAAFKRAKKARKLHR